MAVIARNFITIAEIYDGEAGASVFVADLDNEMTSVAVDAEGKTTEAVTLTTRLSGYEGSTDVTEGMAVTPPTPPDGFTVTVADDGLVTVEILSGTALGDRTELAFSCSWDGAVSGVTLTIAAARPGADGEPATIYELRPSSSHLSAQRDSAGGYSPVTVSLSCGYIKVTGDEEPTIVETATEAFDGHEVFFRMRSRDDSTWGAFTRYADDMSSEYDDLSGITVADYDCVEFVIGASGGTLDEATVIDRETIPITVDGKAGTATTITDKWVKYATTTEATQPAATSSAWSLTMPTSITAGLWLWTWTHVEYSTGDSTDAISVSRTGIDGKGIKSSVITYSQQATSVDPASITDWGGFPTTLTDGYWLYTRTVLTYSDGATSVSYSVSQVGVGSYYAGCEEYYAVGGSATTAPAGYATAGTYANGETVSTTWTQERPAWTAATPYLWNFEVSSDSKGNRYVTSPVCIGNFAKGIESIVETYAISAYSTTSAGHGYPDDIAYADWTDEQGDAAPTVAKPYQWNWTRTTYNDGTADDFFHISAVKGGTGEQGDPGASAVRLDLSNENDTMLYDGHGNLLSGAVTSAVTLYEGSDDVTDTATLAIEASGCTAQLVSDTRTVKVTAMSATTGKVTVTASYDGGSYTAVLTLKKLVGVDKYELILSSNAVTIDPNNDEDIDPATITAQVYRTSQNGSRSLLSTLPTGYSITVTETNTSLAYSSGKATITPTADYTSYTVKLLDASKTTLDCEVVPVLWHGENGDTGSDAVTFSFDPDSVAFSTNDDGSLTAASESATVKAVRKSTEYTATVKSIDVVSGCTAGGSGTSTLTIAPSGASELASSYYDENGELQSRTLTVPPTSGYAIVTATVTIGGTAYTGKATLRFTVDYSMLYETFSTDNNHFLSKFGELATDTQRNWKEMYTELSQTKGSIGMHVYNQYAEAVASDGKNLVPFSYIRYYGSVATPTHTCELEAGKTYSLSAVGFVNATMLTETTMSRMDVIAYADGWAEQHRLAFTSASAELKSVTFTAATGGAWHVYATPVDSGGQASSTPSLDDSRFYVEYFQIEEGGEASEWQACATDDAANAPLCKDWTAAGKVSAERPDGTQGFVAHYDNSDGVVEVDILSKNADVAIEAGATYTLSFYAKGTGELYASLASIDNDTPFYGSVRDGSSFCTDSDGLISVPITSEWAFHEVTFTAANTLANIDALVSAYPGGEAYVYDWKLEKGGKATRGLADNLLPTGLDMYDGLMVVTSDNFQVRNNSGQTTMTVDESGYLTAVKLAAGSDGARVEIGVDGGKPVIRGIYANGTLAWEFNGAVVTIGDMVTLTMDDGNSSATYMFMAVNGTNTLTMSFTITVNVQNDTGSAIEYDYSCATCTVVASGETKTLELQETKTIEPSANATVVYKGSISVSSTNYIATPNTATVTVNGAADYKGFSTTMAFTRYTLG